MLRKPFVSQFGLIQLLLPTELICVVMCSMTHLLIKEEERNSAVCNCPHGVAVIVVGRLWFGGYGSVSTRALTLGGENPRPGCSRTTLDALGKVLNRSFECSCCSFNALLSN